MKQFANTAGQIRGNDVTCDGAAALDLEAARAAATRVK
jgi:hypothetical protein